MGVAEVGAAVSVDPLAGGNPFTARVLRVDSVHDMAILVSGVFLPDSTGPMTATDHLEPREKVTVTGHAVLEDGESTYRFLTAIGTWAGGTTRNDSQPLGRVIADRIVPGMSGAPVIRDSDRRVAGIVTGRYNSADGWPSSTAWVARTEDLAALLDDQAEIILDMLPQPSGIVRPGDGAQPRLLGGRYELDSIVGRGAMAEVYRARDLRLDRLVAVKALREDLARDQMFQARFRREAMSAASLNHPSIVAVFDTGEDATRFSTVPFIVMEYVDGQTIRDLLRDNQGLIPARALELTDGVLRALEYSHQAGIVHGDIKPANVMLSLQGEVKVMDFGIARAAADAQATMTQTAQVHSRLQYVSPEQAKGERVDARSDLYSVGCLLYELLTGTPPFTGDSPVAIAYQHVREVPIAPSRVDRDLPDWADPIVLHAMEKNPAERYQSAADMRSDVQRAQSGIPVAATPLMTASLEHPGPGTRRMEPRALPGLQGRHRSSHRARA